MKVPAEFDSIVADVEKRQDPLPSHYFQTELMKGRAAIGKDLDADLKALTRNIKMPGCVKNNGGYVFGEMPPITV